MRSTVKGALSVALALATTLSMGACQAKQQDSGDTTTNQAAVSDAQIVEYEGTLLTAYDQKVVISGEEGDMEFATSDETLYKTGSEGQMYLDDIVSVKYHVEGNVNHADEIDLVEHMDTAIEFAGTLVDKTDQSITLVDKNLSVTFMIDEDSYIVGDLSKGDSIELTYLGNLSEYPYANVVAVVKEAETSQTATVHGVVSELADSTMLLGIDSAHAYRFGITNQTKVSGAADHLTVGDQVDVTYEGTVASQPNALSITVVKSAPKAEQVRAYTINGTVSSADSTSVSLDTGKATYTFATGKATRFYGEKPTKGYRAEITYTGTLNDKPQASIVYCVKSEQEASKAVAKKDAKKNEKKTASQKDTKKDEKADKKDDAKKDESKKDEKQESNTAQNGGGAASSDSGKSESSMKQDTTETQDSETTPTADESQAAPQPETEPTQEPEVEPTQEPESEPEAEPTQEPEAEPTQEPEADPEPAVTNPDMGVIGQGTIIEGNEKDKTVKIALKDGNTIELTYNDDTKIASGYIPQKGDVVRIEYGSTSLTLKELQLVSRAEAAAEEPAPAEQPEATAETEQSDEG